MENKKKEGPLKNMCGPRDTQMNVFNSVVILIHNKCEPVRAATLLACSWAACAASSGSRGEVAPSDKSPLSSRFGAEGSVVSSPSLLVASSPSLLVDSESVDRALYEPPS